ncbi:uncharacterized protein PB18E9.04c-like [Nicotiana sylvestris]|uniref:uncharacterized protein PB18E9.04c-like n=1 Tax=Nicotiana sylvestris TaxID=4096 RepID=UPI00388CD9E2
MNSSTYNTYPPSTHSTSALPPSTTNHTHNVLTLVNTTTNTLLPPLGNHDPTTSNLKPTPTLHYAFPTHMQPIQLNHSHPNPTEKPNTYNNPSSPSKLPPQLPTHTPTNTANPSLNVLTHMQSTPPHYTPIINYAEVPCTTLPLKNTALTTNPTSIQATKHLSSPTFQHATQSSSFSHDLSSHLHLPSTKPIPTTIILVGDGLAESCPQLLKDREQPGGHSSSTESTRPRPDHHGGDASSHDLLQSIPLGNSTNEQQFDMVESLPPILLTASPFCGNVILPGVPILDPMAPRIHSYPSNASVTDEPFRSTNSFFHLHEPTATQPRRSRRNNTPRYGSSDDINDGSKIGTSMARQMPHLCPHGTIRKKDHTQLPPKGDKVSHQTKATGEPRIRKICSGNHSNTERSETDYQPGAFTHGGTGISPTPTN